MEIECIDTGKKINDEKVHKVFLEKFRNKITTNVLWD